MKGSTLLWNDKVPSYALKECLDWLYRIEYFIDTDDYLSADNDGGMIANLKTFIVKVHFFFVQKGLPVAHTTTAVVCIQNPFLFLQQDIAVAWNKNRNEGKYPEAPMIEQVLSYPTPWSDELINHFAGYINGRLCIPRKLRGTFHF